MKILFVRHGESVDDIEDRYGGWADFDLTEKGKQQISHCAEKIASLNTKFEIILTSPLKRANQAAKIISKHIGVDVEVFEYLKERNLNGILSGMTRSKAKQKYPNLAKRLENYQYVDGSERIEDFTSRIAAATKIVVNMEYNSLVAVTHGLFLKAFFQEILNINLNKVGDGGFILVEEKNSKFMILDHNGVEFEHY